MNLYEKYSEVVLEFFELEFNFHKRECISNYINLLIFKIFNHHIDYHLYNIYKNKMLLFDSLPYIGIYRTMHWKLEETLNEEIKNKIKLQIIVL